jgi:hypothetical protein
MGCWRCGNLAFCARFPGSGGRVLGDRSGTARSPDDGFAVLSGPADLRKCLGRPRQSIRGQPSRLTFNHYFQSAERDAAAAGDKRDDVRRGADVNVEAPRSGVERKRRTLMSASTGARLFQADGAASRPPRSSAGRKAPDRARRDQCVGRSVVYRSSGDRGSCELNQLKWAPWRAMPLSAPAWEVEPP